MALVHFLLVYDHRLRRLVDQREYSDPAAATRAYAELENKHRDEPELEIVLVGADSIETIRRTHGHYFDQMEDAAVVPLALH